MTTTFKTGDIVCHRAQFLRNIGYYTPPTNGVVTNVGPDVIRVRWCDQDQPSPILRCNIIRYDERHLEPR